MTGNLHGKIAVVTGASRGIGAAVVRRYCAEGARVVLSHFPEGEMAELAIDLADELTDLGHHVVPIAADVSDGVQVERLVAATIEAFGVPDVMVANAAAFHRGPWTEVTQDVWDGVFDVNARGTFLCAHSVLPRMIERGSGSIITLSSVTARAGVVGMLPYVASKGAIVAFTRALAREVGPSGIRVNAVAPGAIRTEAESESNTDSLGDYMAKTFQSIPRRAHPDDLTGTFVYLASDDSDFVTGQVLAVDGGWVHR